MADSSCIAAASALRAVCRRLWIGAALTGLLAPVVLLLLRDAWPGSWEGVLLAAFAAGFVLRKAWQARRALQAIRQLRLEARLVAQCSEAALLSRCLEQRGHLWQRCHTLQALQRLFSAPQDASSGAPHHRPRRSRVLRQYRRSFRPMRPARPGLDFTLALLLLAGLALVLRPPVVGLGPFLLLVLFVIGEAMQGLWLHRFQWGLERLMRALSAWTLTTPLPQLLRHAARQPYRHTVLYHRPPWLAV